MYNRTNLFCYELCVFFPNIIEFSKTYRFSSLVQFNRSSITILINFVFPKNKLNTVASVLTSLGVINHIGLCTIDFIMWSYGNDDIGSNKLREQISDTPLILYPFVIIGPSLLFLGLATHALNFIKTNPISSLMVIIGGPFVGLSCFIWNNGILMPISCVVFASGLALLLLRKEVKIIELANGNRIT